MAERERRHVDPEQSEAVWAPDRQDRMGQLGVGGQGGDLQHHPEGQVGNVDVGQGVDLGPVAGQQREGEVEDEEEDQEGPHAHPDLSADEGTPVPPPVTL